MKNGKLTGLAVLVYLMVLLMALEGWGQISATAISLTPSSTTMNRGAVLSLTATLTPEEATADGIQWSVEHGHIATVNPSVENPLQATVKALAPGSTTLTVQTPQGHSATARIQVVVPVTGVSLSHTELELVRGERTSLSARIQPSDATNHHLRWGSDDPETIQIQEAGAGNFGSWNEVTIEAMEAGRTRVWVETQDRNQSAAVDIHVIVLVEAVVFQDEIMEMNSGDTLQTQFEIVPADATNQDVWYESTEPSVATVDENGKVEAHGEGAARIILRSHQDQMIFDHLLVLVDGAHAPEEMPMIGLKEEEPTDQDPATEQSEPTEPAAIAESESEKNGGVRSKTPFFIGAALVILLVVLVMIFRKNSSGEMKKQEIVTAVDLEQAETEEEKIPGRAVVWGLAGEFEGQGIELAENLLIIGRDASLSHLVYPSHREDISRKHVKIEFDSEKGDCWITDVSANGTYLADTDQRLPHDQKMAISSGTRFYMAVKTELFEVEF